MGVAWARRTAEGKAAMVPSGVCSIFDFIIRALLALKQRNPPRSLHTPSFSRAAANR